MAESRVASRYVKSLLELAVEKNELEAVHNDMVLISKSCKSNYDLVMLLKSPIIKHDKKRAILEMIFGDKVSKLTMAIIDILTRKNREPILPAIADQFHVAYNEHMGIQKATITTTVALDTKIKAEIEAIVKKLSNRKSIELEEKIDKDLIGGFVLNVGDKQIDASVSNKLKSLKVLFRQNPYIKEF